MDDLALLLISARTCVLMSPDGDMILLGSQPVTVDLGGELPKIKITSLNAELHLERFERDEATCYAEAIAYDSEARAWRVRVPICLV